MRKGQHAMREIRRGFARRAAAILVGALAFGVSLTLLAGPARAQVDENTTTTSTTSTTVASTTTTTAPRTGVATYPIVGGASATTTTTVPATTTTTKAPKKAALAFTGADVGLTVGAAAVALGLGGVLVLASRKRKAAQ